MKIKQGAVIAVLGSLLAVQFGFAAETNVITSELTTLVGKIRTKLGHGQNTEKDLAPELKSIDDLYASHKSEKSDEVAQILLLKASLYMQVMDDTDKATAVVKQLKADLPDTKAGKQADAMLASFESAAAAKKLQASLHEGATFPDFSETDLAGKPLSIANYKGKVVLIDFWATWCGPCVAELPNVLSTYQKHHADGFEIIGISLDDDKSKVQDFIQQRKMTWQQFFDGKGWSNKLATKYGVESIPATYLLDGQGKIIGRDLRGEALDAAVSRALKKK